MSPNAVCVSMNTGISPPRLAGGCAGFSRRGALGYARAMALTHDRNEFLCPGFFRRPQAVVSSRD